MTSGQYYDMSNEQLAQAFVKISIDEADALGVRNTRAVHKLYKQLHAVAAVLCARGPEARKALVPLLSYAAAPEPFAKDRAAQVRLNAAKELLAVVPEQARATLEDLVDNGPGYQSGSAGMCLQMWQDGVFKPT